MLNNPNLRISILSQGDQDEIVRLRKLEFESTYGERIDSDRLNWNSTDEKSLHLGLLDQMEIVSVLRLTFIDSPEAFELIMKMSAPAKFQKRSAILARAATKKELQGQHLHSTLRTFAFELCEKMNVRAIWGSCESNSKRLQQLESIGYTFERTYEWENGYFQKSSVAVALLLESPERIASAKSLLKNRLKERFISDFFETSFPINPNDVEFL